MTRTRIAATMLVWGLGLGTVMLTTTDPVLAAACCEDCEAALYQCYASCDAQTHDDDECLSRCHRDCRIEVIDTCSNGCVMCGSGGGGGGGGSSCYYCAINDPHPAPGGTTYWHVQWCMPIYSGAC